MGRVNVMTYPSGLNVDYDYDALGEVEKVRAWKTGLSVRDVVRNIAHMPWGPIESWRFGNPDGDGPRRGIGGKGWEGDKNWREAVRQVAQGGEHRTFNGVTPTRAEAERLIRAARGEINRYDEGHEPPNPHTYPHINYTALNGAKGVIEITGL